MIAKFVGPWLLPSFSILMIGFLPGYLWVLPVFLFIVFPVLDEVLRRQSRPALTDSLAQTDGWQEKLMPHPKVHLAFSITLTIICTLTVHQNFRSLSEVEKFLSFWMMGMSISYAGFSAAHESIHSKARFASSLGKLVFCLFLYPQFPGLHLRVHHRYVGTKMDPHTPLLGESFYAYFARSILTGLAISFRLDRLKAFLWISTSFTLLGSLFYFNAPFALGYFLACGLAIVHLELSNYVSHYGLTRTAEASHPDFLAWQDHSPLINAMTYQISLHADHHRRPQAHWEDLRMRDRARDMPLNLVYMLMMALMPFLWHVVVTRKMKELEGAAVR